LSVTTPRARRITEASAKHAASTVSARRAPEDPVVDATFTSVCAAVLLAAFIMSGILAMGAARPVPAYAIFGSALFGLVFGSFLVGALHLALTDSRRHKDDD
jgi:hypothetical protein